MNYARWRKTIAITIFCFNFFVGPTQAGKIYISPGMNSYHFDRDAGYKNENWGLGVQVDFQKTFSLNFGRFKNSEDNLSNYLTGTWYPYVFEHTKIGLLVGGFDGYVKERNGGWFLAGMPIINYSRGKWGVNMAVVPKYKNRIHGAFIVQLLFAIN